MKKLIIITLMMSSFSMAFEYKWAYLGMGSFFDLYQGSNPTEWESRADLPNPTANPAPQILNNFKGAIFFGLTSNMSLGLESEVFYNTIGPYTVFDKTSLKSFSDETFGLGDSRVKFIYEFKDLNLYAAFQTIIPGIYDRPGIDFGPPIQVLPWTGLGAFRIGTEVLYKLDDHSFSGEYIHSLPSGERSSIEANSYESSLSYVYKKGFAGSFNYSLGAIASYKDFTWLRPDKANRKDFAIYPKVGVGWLEGSREYSISAGVSVYSYVKDTAVKKAPASFFVSLYAGFY